MAYLALAIWAVSLLLDLADLIFPVPCGAWRAFRVDSFRQDDHGVVSCIHRGPATLPEGVWRTATSFQTSSRELSRWPRSCGDLPASTF